LRGAQRRSNLNVANWLCFSRDRIARFLSQVLCPKRVNVNSRLRQIGFVLHNCPSGPGWNDEILEQWGRIGNPQIASWRAKRGNRRLTQICLPLPTTRALRVYGSSSVIHDLPSATRPSLGSNCCVPIIQRCLWAVKRIPDISGGLCDTDAHT
jgi:hypothetical protein